MEQEHEQKPENTYIGMSDEYLYGAVAELQEVQRDINREYSQIQAALLFNYTNRLRGDG